MVYRRVVPLNPTRPTKGTPRRRRGFPKTVPRLHGVFTDDSSDSTGKCGQSDFKKSVVFTLLCVRRGHDPTVTESRWEVPEKSGREPCSSSIPR